MRVLGIDPGLAYVGFGVVDFNNNKLSLVSYGVIETASTESHEVRLLSIYNRLLAVIDEFRPDCAEMETLYFARNTTSAMAVSEAIENYLETIYILSLRQNEVHAIDICSYLSYSRPTVSIVLRQMRENGLVTVNDDNHIFLTDEGRAIAARIYERHTVLTSLLVSLGVSRETAQRDACKIEHDLSDETFEAIKRHAREHHIAPEGAQ